MTRRREGTPLALRLAVRLLPADAREDVLGDLVEIWRTRVRHESGVRRLIWLTRQPFDAVRARRAAAKAAAPRGRPAKGAGGRARDGRDPSGAGPSRHRRAFDPRGFGFSWLDVKLGVRMLGKQPILTLVAGATLALGIPAALAPTHVLGIFDSTLPVDEGDRIFGLRNWDLERNGPVVRPLHDLEVWRTSLRSFDVIGAARSDPWNVHSPDGRAAEVRGSEVTASIFEMLRVPPLMGRALIEADEVEGADDVVVISEDLWNGRFARDPEIVGKVIRVGRRPHTIVGVMPDGFLFPTRDHLWLPLRANPNDYEVGAGPDLSIFGRLADGVSKEEALAELETVGGRLAAEWPETHQTLRPEIVSVPLLMFGEPARGLAQSSGMLYVQLFSLALLAIACGNVGVLILARTATRVSEMSVRTALGASRGRILSQLFIESLVLSVGATAVGLVLVQTVVVRVAVRVLDSEMPYWFDMSLGPRSIALALGLAAVCALLAGVFPALKATSANVQRNLQQNAAGNSLRFGPFTTALVVAEVTLSVGFLCLATAAVRSFSDGPSAQAAATYQNFLVASLRTPWVDPTAEDADAYEDEFRIRMAQNHEELRDRLQADGRVRRAAMGLHLPGSSYLDREILFGGDDEAGDRARARTVMGLVHVDYFRDLRLEVLAGRDFTTTDGADSPREFRSAVIVNDQFAQKVFGGGDVVGRQFRYADPRSFEEGNWYEIVGVVETFGTNIVHPERGAAVYHPLSSAGMHPMRFVIEVRGGDPVAFIPELRRIAADVDPEAMVQAPMTVLEVVESILLDDRLITIFVFVLSALGMMLAATGLYALMSFTVAQRRREIGIRTALGAGAGSVVAAIARRAAAQLAAGVLLGSAFGWWMVWELGDLSEWDVGNLPLLIASVAVAVTIFSALACLSPTLRGLRIQPTEALREG